MSRVPPAQFGQRVCWCDKCERGVSGRHTGQRNVEHPTHGTMEHQKEATNDTGQIK